MSVTGSKFRLGILGGGQLGRMLAESAKKLGFDVSIFTEVEATPAEKAGFHVSNDLRGLVESSDKVIFENEFFDFSLLKDFPEEKFFPSLHAIELLSFKLKQKSSLKHLGIETAQHLVYSKKEDLEAWVKETLQALNNEAVFKWSKFGYDGKGSFIFSKESSLADLISFCKKPIEKGVRIFAEEKIEFVEELAMLGCLTPKGQWSYFPLVTTEQSEGICREVLGPARRLDIEEVFEEQAQRNMRRFAEENKLYGSFAFEFFRTSDDRLLVNEVAPRVHNSAHYTQVASNISQFDFHVMACADMKLPEIEISNFFGMRNLIGQGKSFDSSVVSSAQDSLGKSFQFYWYDKQECRPGRKMGHINFLSESYTDLMAYAEKCRLLESQIFKTS